VAKVIKSIKIRPGMRAAKSENKPFGWDHGMKHRPKLTKPRKVKHI
jgi:hypothetical protein